MSALSHPARGQPSDAGPPEGLHDTDAQVNEIHTSGPATTTPDDMPNPEAIPDTLAGKTDDDLVIAYLIPQSERAVLALDRVRAAKTAHGRYITRVHAPSVESRWGHQVWAYKLTGSHMRLQEKGWIMGRGQASRKDPFRGVELMICTGHDKTAKQHIGNFHGRISIHEQSGAWIFRNTSEHLVTYVNGRGSKDVTIAPQETAVLWMEQNRLCFGIYHYLIQFATLSDDMDINDTSYTEHESRYLTFRDRLLSRTPGTVISPQIHPLPRLSHRHVNCFILHEETTAANVGRSTRVQFGVQVRTGVPVAVKQFVESPRVCFGNIGPMARHVLAKSSLRGDHVGIMPFHETWCEHGYLFCNSSQEKEFKYMVMPLALGDFGDFDFSTLSWKIRLGLYHQTLRGLAAIHGLRHMHQNIKPGHLLILDTAPNSPSAAICDLSSVNVWKSSHRDIRPVHTVAPEIWAEAVEGVYTPAADIWGLAYSWLWTMAPQGSGVPGWNVSDVSHLIQLLNDRYPPLVQVPQGLENLKDLEGIVTRDRHAAIMSFVDEAAVTPAPSGLHAEGDGDPVDEFRALLKRMLAWDPEDRISAQDALASPVWAVGEDNGSGQPRQDGDHALVQQPKASKRSRSSEGESGRSGKKARDG